MMPPGGGERRGEALASLTALIHEHATNPEIGDLLEQAHGSNESLSEWQQANLAELQRQWVEATAVPGDLVRALAVAQSRSEQAWREARPRNDWATVLPLLEEVVSLARTRADALAAATGLERYDALLDSYEPELRSADVDAVFADLKTFLPPLVDQALEQLHIHEQARVPGVVEAFSAREVDEEASGHRGERFAAREIEPRDSGSSISPSPMKAHTLRPVASIRPRALRYFMKRAW